jgi:plastocyanin
MLSVSIVAQTNTVNIDWSFNSTPSASGDANSSRTIEVGDTVKWNWYSGGSHNVKSNSNSNESFESSFFTQGGTFEHTFTSIGTNDYVCSPHSGNMFGTITVVAEGTLSTASFDALGTVNMYPNPVESNLTIDFQIQSMDVLDVKIFNILGKQVLSKQVSENNKSLNVDALNNGVYLVRVSSLDGNNSMTKRFVKI